MKFAAMILHALIFALTFIAFVRLPAGSYTSPVVPLGAMVLSLLTVVALLRPFKRRVQLLIIALNGIVVVGIVASIVMLAYYALAYGGEGALGARSAITAMIAVPYIVSILAIRKQLRGVPVGAENAV